MKKIILTDEDILLVKHELSQSKKKLKKYLILYFILCSYFFFLPAKYALVWRSAARSIRNESGTLAHAIGYDIISIFLIVLLIIILVLCHFDLKIIQMNKDLKSLKKITFRAKVTNVTSVQNKDTDAAIITLGRNKYGLKDIVVHKKERQKINGLEINRQHKLEFLYHSEILLSLELEKPE